MIPDLEDLEAVSPSQYGWQITPRTYLSVSLVFEGGYWEAALNGRSRFAEEPDLALEKLWAELSELEKDLLHALIELQK